MFTGQYQVHRLYDLFVLAFREDNPFLEAARVGDDCPHDPRALPQCFSRAVPIGADVEVLNPRHTTVHGGLATAAASQGDPGGQTVLEMMYSGQPELLMP